VNCGIYFIERYAKNPIMHAYTHGVLGRAWTDQWCGTLERVRSAAERDGVQDEVATGGWPLWIGPDVKG